VTGLKPHRPGATTRSPCADQGGRSCSPSLYGGPGPARIGPGAGGRGRSFVFRGRVDLWPSGPAQPDRRLSSSSTTSARPARAPARGRQAPAGAGGRVSRPSASAGLPFLPRVVAPPFHGRRPARFIHDLQEDDPGPLPDHGDPGLPGDGPGHGVAGQPVVSALRPPATRRAGPDRPSWVARGGGQLRGAVRVQTTEAPSPWAHPRLAGPGGDGRLGPHASGPHDSRNMVARRPSAGPPTEGRQPRGCRGGRTWSAGLAERRRPAGPGGEPPAGGPRPSRFARRAPCCWSPPLARRCSGAAPRSCSGSAPRVGPA